MNVGSMKEVRTTSTMLSLSCDIQYCISWIASLPFANPLPSVPSKCPLVAHFRIMPEVDSSLLFLEYHEFGHTTQLTFCFSPAVWK